MLGDFAAQDDHLRIAQGFKVFERIGVDHHKVCGFADFNRAGDVVYACDFRVAERCGVDGKLIADAEIFLKYISSRHMS